jgi:peptide/nickel transport system substrate-binding protein
MADRPARLEDPTSMNITPALCTDWAQEDPTTWVFKMREGVQLHKDYGELTAEDAAFSYNTFIETRGRTGAMTYLDFAEARDKYTFAVKLRLPFSGLINAWAHTFYASIWSKRAYEEMGPDTFGRQPVGPGPFEFEDWKPGLEISLKKFEGYWNPELPIVDRLLFLPVAYTFVKMEKLRQGELDWLDGPAFSQLKDLEQNPAVTVFQPEADEWDYLTFNLTLGPDEPVLNPKVREAIAYAISRNSIVENLPRQRPSSQVSV